MGLSDGITELVEGFTKVCRETNRVRSAKQDHKSEGVNEAKLLIFGDQRSIDPFGNQMLLLQKVLARI